jgi:Protein of unknown function (DUF3300)
MKLFSTPNHSKHAQWLKQLQRLGRFLQVLMVIPLLAFYSPSFGANNNQAVEFSQAELDQLLAPIALYPDTVLSQVLIAATYPIEIIQADRWARANTGVKGADAVKLVENKDWDPSVKALVAFPDILQRMSDDVDWTQKLGDAFLSNEPKVMDTIQNLRKKAYASGSLEKVQHLKVQRSAETIVIEPAQERIVYVPVYDTRVVYGNWWWPEYPPVYWHQPASYAYVSGFYWGPSIYIGPRFFYSSCHWRNRHVVVIDHHHHSHRTFYTGGSIVSYEGARAWRHEPVHRRGVAYYNNRLRDNYGSRRESYRDARVYRDERRQEHPSHSREIRAIGSPRTSPNTARQFNDGRSRDSGNNVHHPRTLSTNGVNFGATESPRAHVDRSEQVRERLSRSHDESNQENNGSRIIRNHHSEHLRNSNEPRAMSEAEQQVSRDLQRQSLNRQRAERIQNIPRDDNASNNRILRIDNSINRRIESPRTESPRTSGNIENPRRTIERSDDSNRGNRGNRAN